MASDWYWAAYNKGPAEDRFVIVDGKADLWARVRREVDPSEHCAWNPVHPGKLEATIEDILEIMFTVMMVYRVNQNRFVLEAAKIPVFAEFLRRGRHDLCNYVSNTTHPSAPTRVEPYSDAKMRALGEVVSRTLGIEADWY